MEDEIVDSNFLYKKKVGEFYFSCVTTSRGFASSVHYYSFNNHLSEKTQESQRLSCYCLGDICPQVNCR